MKRIFLRCGKDNKENRINFVKFWANYVKTHPDKNWSEQQNMLIDSQIEISNNTRWSKEQFEILRKLRIKENPDYRKI